MPNVLLLIDNSRSTLERPVGVAAEQRKIIYDAIQTVMSGARLKVRAGAMVYGENNHGGRLISEINPLVENAEYNAFLKSLPGGKSGALPLKSNTARPQAEALYDAYRYFKGEATRFASPAQRYSSPIRSSCDKNYIIFVTNGLPSGEEAADLASEIGDADQDGRETSPYGDGTHYLDDTAKKIYDDGGFVRNADGNSSLKLKIVTHMVVVFGPDDPLFMRAADAGHGNGSYFAVNNSRDLANALSRIVGSMIFETEASFTAPVLAANPENRASPGNRIYMGLFKTLSGQNWYGNLKKYGLDSNNNIIDKNGTFATYVDIDSDGRDDRIGDILPPGNANGNFRSSSQSYWSPSVDGGTVLTGGTGRELQNREFVFTGAITESSISGRITGNEQRLIYTHLGTSTALKDPGNIFIHGNDLITPSLLDLPGIAARDKLIAYIHGIDVYDEDGDADRTEKRGWLLGDVLHSKPLAIHYRAYPVSSPAEQNCEINRTILYVGSNDGMLHAFRDCDGSEAWAFIPPDMLKRIKYIKDMNHTYFVDSTVSAYVYDRDKNGNIEISDGDRAILVFGLRRGGGLMDSGTPTGFYYALDVSDPADPHYVWGISSASEGFSELAESWSEPKIGMVKIGTTEKIVAFTGAGYDNCNEDARFGSTQGFPGSCVSGPYTNDHDVDEKEKGKTSSSSSPGPDPVRPKGRGVYVMEIADLKNGILLIARTPIKIWSYTHANNAQMGFSIASEITALDTNYDGFIDKLYAADTGGSVWRFNVSSPSPSHWTAAKVFGSNTGSGTDGKGRKVFHKISAAIEADSVMLFFGTGDREHPLNRALVDRIYGIIDRGQTTAKTERDLVDLTDNVLQTGTKRQITNTLSALADMNKYGWLIKLNEHSGEKVLAPAVVFQKVVYIATYSPETMNLADLCGGNRGTGRMYAVDYRTGEAVMNYDRTNDVIITDNKRATPSEDEVLLRSDRVVDLGPGIPSGIVLRDNVALIGMGGGIVSVDPKKNSFLLPIYWRRR